ncbi:MAG TPA: LPP20 family lipoprotein [Gammaproteobacteria bacterium]|jgi:hypothetical protein
MKRHATLLLCLLAAACASTPGGDGARPDWIDGQSSEYPQALFLSGQGSALTPQDAKDRARSELAKQFEVAVRERSQQAQTFSSQQTGDESVQSLEQRVSRQLLTSTAKSLQGVQIAEQWHDQSSGQYHALAVLSRSRARLQFEQEIAALDDRSRQWLRRAENEDMLLKRAGCVQQAIAAQQQRSVVQSSLQVVDASGRGQPSVISLAELERSRDTLLSRITLQPSASGAMASELSNLLSAATASAGFKVTDSTRGDYRLLAQALLDPVIEQDGWYWIRGTLQLKLVNDAGNDIGVKRWELKASSTNVERARQRFLSDTDALLKDELRQVLLGFAVKP